MVEYGCCFFSQKKKKMPVSPFAMWLLWHQGICW